jgi:hypothetical protein
LSVKFAKKRSARHRYKSARRLSRARRRRRRWDPRQTHRSLYRKQSAGHRGSALGPRSTSQSSVGARRTYAEGSAARTSAQSGCASACWRLEQLAKQGTIEGAAELLADLEKEFNYVRLALERERPPARAA